MRFIHGRGTADAGANLRVTHCLRMPRRQARETGRHLRSGGLRRLVGQVAGQVLDQRAREFEDQAIVFADQRFLLSGIVQADLVLASPSPACCALIDRDDVTGRGLGRGGRTFQILIRAERMEAVQQRFDLRLARIRGRIRRSDRPIRRRQRRRLRASRPQQA